MRLLGMLLVFVGDVVLRSVRIHPRSDQVESTAAASYPIFVRLSFTVRYRM
jgi:hypothetical protein